MRPQKSRRSFLESALGFSVTAPFASRIARAGTHSNFDPDFGTASEAIRAIRSGAISSRELVEHTYKRIKQFNPKVNAFITLLEEPALAQARQADEALARRKSCGPLHGLPILIKDSFETAGIRTTSGSKTLENYIPKEDAVAVGRLRAAGGIIVGKTNLPEFAGDVQTYNQVAGTTNNPWDDRRTPGGSTGGGAAAIAAGFGVLELGSDIGGSIRTPCHFCGVYGHKTSLNIVPRAGHIPPPPGRVAPVIDLGVFGPLARSAQDLALELEIIAGPDSAKAVAYRWKLPPPRRSSLKQYRVGYVLDDPFCPLTPEVAEVHAQAIERLRWSHVELTEGWPAGVDPQKTCDNYFLLLEAFFSTSTTEEQLTLCRNSLESPWAYYAKMRLQGATCSHRDWLAWSALRLKSRTAWQEYFQTHDAFLMPECFTAAFPHNHELSFYERTIPTSQGPRLYGDALRWISFATLAGCPATIAPIGRTKDGLPVGIQIVGPYLEDATPINLAGLMVDIVGGFEPPPGFSS